MLLLCVDADVGTARCTHSALIFKKAKLQEARGQIGWAPWGSARPQRMEERCSRMHLQSSQQPRGLAGWLAGPRPREEEEERETSGSSS